MLNETIVFKFRHRSPKRRFVFVALARNRIEKCPGAISARTAEWAESKLELVENLPNQIYVSPYARQKPPASRCQAAASTKERKPRRGVELKSKRSHVLRVKSRLCCRRFRRKLLNHCHTKKRLYGRDGQRLFSSLFCETSPCKTRNRWTPRQTNRRWNNIRTAFETPPN